jgi:glucan phosphoethanolaminetransferase (alkaline phosphatase superfamily)
MTSKNSSFVDSCIYGVVGLPIGLFVGVFIPTVVFHTTKPLHFMHGVWIWGMALMVATTLAISVWVKKSKKTPVKQIIFASFTGICISCLVALPISFWFAHAHRNGWENREGFGDFFKWITPASYLIMSVGLIAYFVVLLMPTRDHRLAEQAAAPDG